VDYTRDQFTISTDKSRLDLAAIHQFLTNSYWATGIPMEIVQKAVEHSLCFGVYEGTAQVGFARVITDYTTFAYLADVFVLESHRGQGLSKWLVSCIISHPELQGLRRFMLATRDAHELYRNYAGFQNLSAPERWMEIARPNIYQQSSVEGKKQGG